MEILLHYVWRHRLFPLQSLTTSDGQEVEVIDPGLHNTDAGPDFFNAKVKIGGTLWVGNVEIHTRPADWMAHGHDRDAAYDNVVLHVVGEDGPSVQTSTGRTIPQLTLPVPQRVKDNYAALLAEDRWPPCRHVVATLAPLRIHSWMSALQTERLQQKTEAIAQRAKLAADDWEKAFFITLARNFGFGINGDAFETWARALPLDAVGHHRDDIFQIESIFMGMAGLLDIRAVAPRRQMETAADDYFQRLSSEWKYMAHKFHLTPIDPRVWRFLRLRPQNFPYIRISQLAQLYYSRRCSLSTIASASTLADMRAALATAATPYWHTHYTFGHESTTASDKHLSAASTDLVIINTVVPMLYAYGRHTGSERLCQRAFDFLEQLKPERNSIITTWQACGLKAENAGDTQAIVQLKRNYCDRKACLRCRFGYEYLKADTPPQGA